MKDLIVKNSSQYIYDIEWIISEAKEYLPSHAFVLVLDGIRSIIEEFEEDIEDE